MIKPDPPASLADTREAVERLDARGETIVAGRRGAGRGDRPRPRRVGRRDADRRADQLLRQPGARAADRRDRRAPLPRLPGHALVGGAARVPRVRARADGVHELLRPAEGRGVRQPAPGAAAAGSARRRTSTSSAPTPGLMTTREAARNPIYGVLSGPSGGVAGALFVARKAGFDDILTFDMGGTSTDVALCQNGQPTIGRETCDRPLPHQGAVASNVHTVGAGGGSIAHVPELTRALRVGPQSAGAEPGPAAYGKGGTEPTVTDANVVLGHLPPRLLGGEMAARRRGGPRGGADDRRRDGPRLGRAGRRGDPRDRQREHGGRAAARLGAARPRPARLRARRLRRRRPAARERARAADGLVPGDRPAGAGPPLRDRRPRRRLPRRVRPDVHPPARRRERRRGRGHPRRARRARAGRGSRARGSRPTRSGSPTRPTCATTARATRSPSRSTRRRFALDGLADLEERFNGLHEQLYGFRMPGTASRDRQPARGRLRRGAEARAADRRAPGPRTRRARSSTSTRSCSRASASPTKIYDRAKLQPGAALDRPGDRHRVRLDDRRPAGLPRERRRQLQHPDHPRRLSGERAMAVTERASHRRDPATSRSTRSRSTSSRAR